MGTKELNAILRQYALIRLKPEYVARLQKGGHVDDVILKEPAFIYFGEIPNMPGHCVVAGQSSGRVYAGYHIENFVEIDSSEA